MRVAHFIHRYPPALGGSEAYFARLGAYLARHGDDVHVFTTTALDLEAFRDRSARRLPPGRRRQDGVTVHRFPLTCVPLAHRWVLKALSLLPLPRWQALTEPCNPITPAMWRQAGRPGVGFDLVHATAFPYSFPLACARRLARRLGVPLLLTPFVHTGDPDDPHDRTRLAYTKPALIELARDADRVFVQTEGERQELLRNGVEAGRLVLQGLGVDPADCTGGDRAATRRRWGAAAGELVVGHLATNSVEKGSVDLLRAAEITSRTERAAGLTPAGASPAARLRFVLAGPEAPSFRAFWRRYRPPDGVLRLGPLDDRQKRDFFAAIDVFALPSRSDSFGLVLPEAWANGAACVGYRAGGVAWVIRDGVDGLLVRCGDVAGLAAALLRLAGDEPLRRRLGAAGRARLPDEFDWEQKLALVRAVYREVTAR